VGQRADLPAEQRFQVDTRPPSTRSPRCSLLQRGDHARRADPGEDLISALAVAEVAGEGSPDWDILGFCSPWWPVDDTTGN